MKLLPVALFLLAALSGADQNNPRIVIRFLNGKNGKSISDRQVTIQFGSGAANWLDANSSGEIVLEVPRMEARDIRVRPDHYFDCRFKHDQAGPAGLELKYLLDEILSKGIVGGNLCGKASAQPTPGVLTLYLRPRTFIEDWRL